MVFEIQEFLISTTVGIKNLTLRTKSITGMVYNVCGKKWISVGLSALTATGFFTIPTKKNNDAGAWCNGSTGPLGGSGFGSIPDAPTAAANSVTR